MKFRGDIEAVNLNTGEQFHRVSGDGENHLISTVFTNCNVCGIKLRTENQMGMCIRCAAFHDYEAAMDEAIQEIIRDVKKRAVLADDARTRRT